jgi:hypothetical protein
MMNQSPEIAKSPAKTAFSPLVVPDGSQKVDLSQGVPVDLGEVQL